jgi:hypothetical protein
MESWVKLSLLFLFIHQFSSKKQEKSMDYDDIGLKDGNRWIMMFYNVLKEWWIW